MNKMVKRYEARYGGKEEKEGETKRGEKRRADFVVTRIKAVEVRGETAAFLQHATEEACRLRCCETRMTRTFCSASPPLTRELARCPALSVLLTCLRHEKLIY